MFTLESFHLQDMTACAAALRRLGDGARSLEEASGRITQFLYQHLTTSSDARPACALVRLFKTHPYECLAPELQALADAKLGDASPTPGMKCLTLLGSAGAVPGWNDPAQSSRFRVIPLASDEALAQFPMFSQLFTQFGIDLPHLQTASPSVLIDREAHTFNVFYVPEAIGSPFVPAQQHFVGPFGIRSVLGFGSMLATGEMFAVVLFATVPVPRETAELLRPLALSTRLALAPFERDRLILPTWARGPSSDTTSDMGELASLKERVATLESLLAVQEQTVASQSRRLEASLAESRQQTKDVQAQSLRFETLSATSPTGIFQTDEEGAYLYTNTAWQTIAGYSHIQSLGHGWTSTIFEEDRRDVLQAWTRSIQQRLAFSLEFRLQRPDETVRWVHMRSRPLVDEDGQIMGHVGTMEDVTDRKQADAALRRTQFAMDHAVDAVYWIDAGARIRYANAAASAMLGYSPEEFLHLTVHDLNPDFPVDRWARFWTETRNSTTAAFEAFHRAKDGRLIPVDIHIRYLAYEGQEFHCAFVRNLTERKAVETTRLRLQQAINHAHDGIALLDETGRYTYMNPSYALIYGYRVEELLGQSWTMLYDREWLTMIEQLYLPILLAEGYWQGEVVGRKKSGDTFHVELSLALLDEPGSDHRTMICTCRDISRRKELAQDLLAAKEAAEAGARAKAEFLATMSHEIRTPMNGVLGMTGLLLDTALSAEQRDWVDTLRASSESLLAIINDILDFSKIEAGKLDLAPIPFDIHTTLDQVLDLLALSAQRRQVELVGLVNADVPPVVIGDPGRIKQILTNLMSNAIKFTEHGDVSVVVSTVAQLDPQAVGIHVDVTDTGIGIASDVQARLFQSFSQADSSTTRKYGGTGLGLAICKQLVELMHGHIGVESTLGQGSRFWFEIPLGRAERRQPLPDPVRTLAGKRLCIIDDNALSQRVLIQHATRWGMEACVAADGAAALPLLMEARQAGRPIDVALLGMPLAKMNGLDLVRQIKATPLLREVPVVLLTGNGQRGDGKAAQDAGVSAYLTKPIRGRQLAECLRLVLGRQGAGAGVHPLVTRHTLTETEARTRHHLLVVDDNVVNQKVAAKMLEKLGHRVDLAKNGREAIAAIAQRHYALVFMDCQMPEMDGFDATRELRRLEQTSGSHLPVIAMTANAMAGDREQCLDSGMDDFMSKPIDVAALARMLARWLPTTPSHTHGSEMTGKQAA